MEREAFFKIIREGAKTGIHDWIIDEIALFLEKRGWVVEEKHFGNEPGPDILAVSPNGEYYIFESEIEHASGRQFAKNKLRMINKSSRRRMLKKIIFIGLPKHESKFKEVCEEENVSFQTETLSPEEFLKIDDKKLEAIIDSIGT
jgi:hypothetical protein